MRSRNMTETAQSAYLLEYGRRRIRICADTFRNLAQIFEEGDEGGREDPKRERAALLLKKRMEENRHLLAGNLKEMADIMNGVADESVRFIRLGGRRQKQLIRGLQGEGITAGEVYLLQRGNGRMELSVLLSSRTGNSRTVEEAADYLSVLLDMRLVSSRRNPFFIGENPLCYFFEEEPGYLYMTGSACAVKETESVSGDNFAFFEAGDGNLTVALSDGMGSGEEACQDSEAVMDMAESMLQAGLTPEMTIQLLNGSTTGGGTRDRLPTLDLCNIDLYEGRCLFLKMGAAVSYVRHGSVVERISSGALPLGAFGQAQAERARREVSDGDYIILVSDGVTEGWRTGDGEERVRRMLAETDAASPSDLAGRVLRYAIEQQEGRIRDDMTVLVVGIWERDQAKETA